MALSYVPRHLSVNRWLLLAGMILSVAAPTVSYAQSGLVAAWGFNEGSGTTVSDVSGSGNTGTIQGATWSTLGRFGNALSFDGSNDIVLVPSSASLNMTTGLTVSAWVFPTGSQSGWRAIVQKEVDAYFLHASSSNGARRPAAGGTFNGTGNYVAAPSSIANSTWTHLALTYDGVTIRLFVNGTLVASTPQTGALENNNSPLRIGGNSPYIEFFQGRIDDVRIYNRAQVAAEIQSDMAVGVGSGPADTTIPTVTITGPTSNPTHAVTSTPLTISGTAGDNLAVTQVSWSNNRGGSGTATGTTSWTAAGIALLSGDNVLTVTARDAAGNLATDVLTVTYTPQVDGIAPTVTITTPTSNPVFTATTSPFTLGGSAGDNVGVTQVSWSNERGGSGTATGTTSWSAAGIALLAGDNVLTVTARDAAGNVASDILTVTYEPPPTPPGLVAAWGFNEGAGTTVADISGNNNTGTIQGPTWSTQGRYGNALSFDGSNDIVLVPSSASLNVTTGLTVSAWVFPTAAQGGWRAVVQKEVDAYFLHASNNGGALRPAAGGTFNGTGNYIEATSAIAVSTWTHLALTYDGATIRMFVNGNLVSSAPQTGALENNTNALRIGGNSPYTEFFLGRIDDVRIYNRALAASEILSDMAVGVGSGSTPPDGTAPTVSITGPTSNPTHAVTTTPLNISGTAGDNVGVTQVSWTNDRGGSGVASGTTAWSVTGITLLTGDNILTVTARDAAGNVATDVLTVTFTPPDVTAPGVTITGPTSNPTHSVTTTPLTISGTASDNVGVTQVSWVNDRGGSGTATGTTSWTAAGVALLSGSNVLTVTARDAAGNVATDVLTVTYTPPDVTAPGVTITGPTSNPTHSVTTTPLTISGTASDNVGVTQVSWVNDRGGSGTATGTTSWTAAGIALLSGSNVLTVTARDAAGNTATDVLTVTYTPADATAPTVTITGPTSDPTLSATVSQLSISGTAADNVAVTQVSWANNRGGSGVATGTTSWSVTGIVLQSGDNVLTVTARDAAGNTATDVLTVTYTPPDGTAPAVTITGPTANPTHSVTATPLTISGTASDNVGVTLVSWVNNRGGSGNATGTTSWTAAGIVLQSGDNVLTVTARDAAGNTATDVLTVTYTPPDATAPAVTITGPTANPTLTVTTTPLTISGTASDNVAVTQVNWANDRGGTGTATGTATWSATGIPLLAGDNVLTVTARDAAGNVATDVLTVTYEPPAPQSGLVAAFGFNEGSGASVADVSGNGNTGTIQGPLWSTLGRYGNALSFDGSNDIVLVPSSASLNMTTGLTVSAWVFPTGSQSGWRAIVQKEVDTYFLHASNSSGALRPAAGATFANGTGNYVAAPSAIANNTWTHLALTYDGATIRLFVNGTLVTSAPQTGALENNNNPLRIGGNSPYTEFFLGRIDDVRIYNRAQLAAEIQSDMAVGVGSGPPDTTVPTVTITDPTSNPTHAVTSTPLTISGTAGDNLAVTQVSWSNNRGGSGTATGTTSWTAAGIALLSGDNVLTVTARDAAGNLATDVLTVTYTPQVDGIAPTVTITTPTSNPAFTATTSPLTLGGSSGDNIGVTQVSWINDRGGSGTATGTTSWSASGIALQAGDNVLTVTARDAAGNVASDILTVTYAPPPTPPGLVAAWGFNEGAGTTVADVSGNNNTGTIQGPTWSTQGRYGNALTFDGSNDIVLVPSSASLNVTTGLTVSAWVFPTAAQSGWRAIVQKEVDSYFLHASNNGGPLRPAAGGTFNGTGNYVEASSAIALTTWTHLALTYDGATIRLFVNGNLVSSAPQTGALENNNNALRIGGNSPYTEFFLGRIDDVRIYNRALAASEIQSDMAVGVGGAPMLNLIQPAEGAIIPGTTVNVAYTASGNLAEVDHVHFQLDSNPEVMDLSFDGAYQFTNVLVGSHVLRGYLVRADHSKILGTDAQVSFSTGSLTDTTPPSVTMTSPAQSATLNGTVTVSANASDNSGVVAGVQFLLDGNPLGAEITTAPYSIAWNTVTTTNGAHTLTARARDGSGNSTVSAPVTVTVANSVSSDPSVIGSWGPVMNWPLVALHMTLMPNGKVLVWDDHTNGTGAGVFDPATNAVTTIPFNNANLFCAGHNLLPDGRVFVAGGHQAVHVGIANTTLFSPTTQNWSNAQQMAVGRWYPTVTTLPDGRMLTLSGEINCDDCNALIPEIFNPATGNWTTLPNAPLDLPYYPHAFVLPNGRIIVTGANKRETQTYMLDVASQLWTTVDTLRLHAGSSVMYLPGKFMKSGRGRDPDLPGAPSVETTYVLDMTTGTPQWRQTASMAYPRTQHNLTLLPDGSVLATGGGINSDVFDPNAPILQPELWDPVTETWTLMASMQIPRIYHSTAALMPDGRVLSAGGGRWGPDHLDAEFYSPPYLFKGPRPTITSAPSSVGWGANFFVGTPNGANIGAVNLLRLSSVTHAFNMNQRFVKLTFQQTAGGLTVQSPANANLAPPGHYMLFILDNNGVPSVASIVRIQ